MEILDEEEMHQLNLMRAVVEVVLDKVVPLLLK